MELFNVFNPMRYCFLGFASGIYNIFKTGIMAATYMPIGGSTYPLFLALLNNSYVFDPDHKYVGEFLGTYQCTGVVYVAGGHALSAPAISQDDTNDLGKLDAGDWVLGSETITARYGVIYSSSGVGADLNGTPGTSDPLLCCIDFGSDKTSTAGSFTIQFATGGIVNIT